MLSEKSRPVIEATLPVIAERIPHITPVFYQDMFEARPDLMDGMFSRSSQREGTQPRALAGSIAMFAQWIVEHPDSYPDEVLSRVAHKHASLGLRPDEYPTVYEHLFGAIAKDLGEAATPEVVEAWTEVYWLMADALIKLEKGLYAQQANDVVRAPFRLAEREEAGEGVAVLTFEPADDTPMTPAQAGQYVSVFARATDGLLQPRQFTLLPSAPRQRKVAIKRDPAGEMTPVLLDAAVGDVLEISNPYGDVTIGGFGDDGSGPLWLFSAGIGITPMIAFVHELAEQQSAREVVAVHSDHSLEGAALFDELVREVSRLKNGRVVSFASEGPADVRGRVDAAALDVPADAVVYLCGPLPFMQAVRSQLVEAGIPGQRIQYEIFGPDQWMLHDEARAEA